MRLLIVTPKQSLVLLLLKRIQSSVLAALHVEISLGNCGQFLTGLILKGTLRTGHLLIVMSRKSMRLLSARSATAVKYIMIGIGYLRLPRTFHFFIVLLSHSMSAILRWRNAAIITPMESCLGFLRRHTKL